MSLTVNDSRSITHSSSDVHAAALRAIGKLEGTILRDEPESGEIEAKFHKTILGKVLGDRTHMSVKISVEPAGSTLINTSVYPLNAVGQRLQFGARKGVSKTVVQWFNAHLDHQLTE